MKTKRFNILTSILGRAEAAEDVLFKLAVLFVLHAGIAFF